ncbi:MAG: DUF1573 domain-containing protein [Acidobacteriota bacterium]|nr:DUF1573 domain-containing protein [Acidobacteriota bacterium]
MKRMLMIASVALVCATLFAKRKPAAAPVVKLSTQTCHMGRIKLGVPATCTFVFTNVSRVPVFILSAVCRSRGCSAAGTKAPILPGKEGSLIVTYRGAVAGRFHAQTVVKISHSTAPIDLAIWGEVMSAQP